MSEPALMKDGLNKPAIERIASAFAQLEPSFRREAFVKSCMKGLSKLELKQRVKHIIAQLKNALPDDFERIAYVLCELPSVWDGGDPDDPMRGFAAWPVTDLVTDVGIETPQRALDCLEKLTPLFSAEFAIRDFILRYPELCFERFTIWLKHEDHHVRRLVSEGTRPRLPWGKQLKPYIQNPSALVPLLDTLKTDASLYVRRSVANNLNDIAKDHPGVVVDICRRWRQESGDLDTNQKADLDWVIKHATRTLIKQGHPESFVLRGFTPKPKVDVEMLNLDKCKLKLGDTLKFELKLAARANNQKFVVDFAIHHMKANGHHTAKVFKLKDCILNKQETIVLEKSTSFKPITTRKYYSGDHFIAVHINGEEKVREKFELKVD